MRSPLAVILSHDSVQARLARESLDDHFDVLECASLQEATDLVRTTRPQFVLAQLTDVRAGGFAEGRFLEWLAAEHAETHVVVGLDTTCPEPLQRAIVDSQATTVRAHRPGELLTAVARVFPSFAAGPSGGERPAAVDPGAIRQRFSTRSNELGEMLDRLAIAAVHDVTVLLIGETGCGKTFLSHLIHDVSPRAAQPFLHVACGALPSDLIESELFGHVRGAFTGALADKDGKFLAAGRGTVLLDEIDVLQPDQQVKLLRIIETGEFEPVGSNQTLRSEARLIAASNRELQPLVEEGAFRPDLYYRLNMLKFDIPPLRERVADIGPLARRFVAEHARSHNICADEIDPEFLTALHAYPWPGNVRELENAVRSAVIYSRGGRVRACDLPPHIVAGEAGPSAIATPTTSEPASIPSSLDGRLKLKEREIIEQALASHNQNRTRTAAHLGISRVTLYNKMKRYGIV